MPDDHKEKPATGRPQADEAASIGVKGLESAIPIATLASPRYRTGCTIRAAKSLAGGPMSIEFFDIFVRPRAFVQWSGEVGGSFAS